MSEMDELLASKKAEGLRIDPETAEVACWYVQVLNPYGIYPDNPEYDCVGKECFARAPGSEIWVMFSDLPEETRQRLEEKLWPNASAHAQSLREYVDNDVPF